MLKITLLALILVLTLASAQTVPFEPGESLPAGDYKIDRIIDGDGLVVTLDGVQRSVRLIGIDARELRPLEPFAKEAKQFLADLLTGQTVTIIPGTEPVDRFGRALGYVSLQGRDVALTVASQGFADQMTLEPNSQFKALYKAAVAGAQAARKGMWQGEPYSTRKWRCNDFQTQAAAQSFFDGAKTEESRDAYRLDRDGDTVACESLPN